MQKRKPDKMKTRKMLTLYGWDATKVQIPLPKYSYWFKKTHQHRCVVSCKNYPTVIYISDFGFATMGYCEAHASRKIMLSLLNGFNERGIWIECLKGKLVPFSGYDIIDTMLKIITDKKILKRLKLKKAKLIQFKKEHSIKNKKLRNCFECGRKQGKPNTWTQKKGKRKVLAFLCKNCQKSLVKEYEHEQKQKQRKSKK